MPYTIANAVGCQFNHVGCKRPTRRELDKVRRGHFAKLTFIEGTADECMWVIVASRDGFGRCTGYLDSRPNDIESVSAGDAVDFTVDNICRLYNAAYIRDVVTTTCHGIVSRLKTWVEYARNGRAAASRLERYERASRS